MFEKDRIAIDIGERYIKILVGTKGKINFHGVIKTPENCVEGDKLVDINNLIKVISNFIEKKKIKSKKLCFVIESRDIVTRNMETPIMDEQGIRKSVEWETAQYLPTGGEEYYIDFEIIDKIIESNKKVYKLLVAAVPKSKIDNYVNLAQGLKLDLVSIDISSNTVARVFRENYKQNDKNESIGIINIEDSSSSIIILDKGKFFIERAVPFGINNILKLITASDIEDLEEEQYELLRNFNIMSLEQGNEVNRKIQTLLDNVFLSFDRIIQFYASGKTQKKLKQLYVIGNGAVIQDIDEYIANYFGTPTDKITKSKDIGIKTKLDLITFIKPLGVLLRKE
jgi:type IV pilus assembly protein PilM